MKVVNLIEFALEEIARKKVITSIRERYSEFELIDENSMKLKITIPRVINGKSINFGNLFKFAEKLKDDGFIADYSICETTLEQIFKYFANDNNAN